MTEHKPRPGDVESPQAIVKAMYETISGPAGSRNWYRLRSLYLPGARLIPIGKRVMGEGGLKVLSVDEWIEEATPLLEETDFYEKEIMSHHDRFGNMMQVFSTYEASESADGPPMARGINSFHLLFHENRWWIVTVMWDNESKENPLPEEFLPYLW